jgi:hypothetical protein
LSPVAVFITMSADEEVKVDFNENREREVFYVFILVAYMWDVPKVAAGLL